MHSSDVQRRRRDNVAEDDEANVAGHDVKHVVNNVHGTADTNKKGGSGGKHQGGGGQARMICKGCHMKGHRLADCRA